VPESVLVVLILTIIIFIVSILAKGVVRLIGFGLIAILALTMLPRLRSGVAEFINPDAAVQQEFGSNYQSGGTESGFGSGNTGNTGNSDRIVQPFSTPRSPQTGSSNSGQTNTPSRVPANPSGPGNIEEDQYDPYYNEPPVGAFW
jgi:hypothetical protein